MELQRAYLDEEEIQTSEQSLVGRRVKDLLWPTTFDLGPECMLSGICNTVLRSLGAPYHLFHDLCAGRAFPGSVLCLSANRHFGWERALTSGKLKVFLAQ